MGTASLVFGFILIGVGVYIIFVIELYPTTDEELGLAFLAKLILGIPFMVIGGLLLRKYDKDKKKEKSQT